MRLRIPVITKKLVLYIVAAFAALCALISAASYVSFSRQFKRHIYATIQSISAAANECLPKKDLRLYLETLQEDEEYAAAKRILQDFVDKFDLNMIYVSSVEPPDYKRISYIFNPVKKDGRWSPFPLGYTETYVEPDYNSTAKRVFENGETIVRHTIKTRSGSHITAMIPVYRQGRVVAVLGAQKSIQEFVAARFHFLIRVLVYEIIFSVLFVVIFSTRFNADFMKPLFDITRETDRFASRREKPDDSLLLIKNRDEIGILAHTIHQMELDVLRNVEELTRVTAEKERISAELNLAAGIQKGVLQKNYPAFPERKDFDLAASMTPAKEVGGDLYDYLMLDDEHLMIVVGDVSGKGIPAALFMVIVKTLLSSHAEQGLSPKEIFEFTNGELCKENEMELFVTCWLGIINLNSGEIRFVNAGHTPPVLFHNGEFSYLKTKPNFVLAGIDGAPYDERTVVLERGDRLFLYTDGVTEATDAKNELFGEERLLQAMEKTRGLDAPGVINKVRDEIDSFVAGAEQFDDITMLEFIRNGDV